MIEFAPVVSHKDLVLKAIPHSLKICAICLKPADCLTASICADCLYPYDNQQFLFDFDYFDYLKYSAIDSIKARQTFIETAVLNPCSFCGGDAVLQEKSFSLYERYYPYFLDSYPQAYPQPKHGNYKDTLRSNVFYLGCSGCTFSTEYLYLYQFYAFYNSMIYAWNNGNSRLSLIKYTDLRLPDWSINYQLLKTIKAQATDYLKKFNPQQSLFPESQTTYKPKLSMSELYALYG